MIVTRVNYRNWRNISECSVQLTSGINVLWGMNAQGKSNILEGIYYFARGRSFRGAKEKELIRFGSDFASASLAFRKDGYDHDTVLDAVIPSLGKKKLSRNGALLSSSAEMIGSFRSVLFSPANLAIVSGSPAERRAFLDIAISQLSGAYLSFLRKYTKLLSERNALIKRAHDGERVSREEWQVYSEGLSECAAWIAAYRQDYLSRLSEAVSGYFKAMTGEKEIPHLRYVSHCADEDPSERFGEILGVFERCPDLTRLYEKLNAGYEREIAAGTTLWGIHKDDVAIYLNGREAKLYASQGQQRSIVLSLKLAEAEIAKKTGGEYPVILLDDVFSELDESRRHFILDSLSGGKDRQIIITSCEPDIIPGERSHGVNFKHVIGGKIEYEIPT